MDTRACEMANAVWLCVTVGVEAATARVSQHATIAHIPRCRTTHTVEWTQCVECPSTHLLADETSRQCCRWRAVQTQVQCRVTWRVEVGRVEGGKDGRHRTE